MSPLAQQIATRAETVRDRIAAACARAGRAPDEVTLVAVTKTFPVETVRAAVEAGLTDLGENRVQELETKAEAVPGAHEGGPVHWHLIGSLQRNKARGALAHADCFHALDSPRLAAALDRRAADAERTLECFVQVNVSGEDSKSGFAPEALAPFLDTLGDYPHLTVTGLMTLAAPAADDAERERVVRPQLRRLAELRAAYAGGPPNVRLRHLSMGMSGDFEIAVEEGATHVRLGTALFGAR